MKLARLATAWAEVVGIVGEVKRDGLHHDAGPHLYMSNLQFPWPTLRIAVRSPLDAAAVAAAVRGVVQSLDPLQPVSDVKTMARLTGAPVLYRDRLYVPVSSIEEGPGRDEKYECCKFRGALVALDAYTGKILWKNHTI
jgi:hypothetical protein